MVAECKTIFERDDLLGLRYNNSRLLWVSPRSTLVPQQLFDADGVDLYLTFNHGKVAGEQTMYNHIGAANLYNVFSCPAQLADILKLYQPNINFFHHATPIIELSVDKTDSANIFTYFYSGNLDIIVIDGGKMLFYNTFKISAPEDSLYYFTLVFNSINVATNLVYVGNCKKMPFEMSLLKFYVNDLTDFEPPSNVAYSDCITKPISKDFVNLFNLHRCE
jgi:hypothetical protein